MHIDRFKNLFQTELQNQGIDPETARLATRAYAVSSLNQLHLPLNTLTEAAVNTLVINVLHHFETHWSPIFHPVTIEDLRYAPNVNEDLSERSQTPLYVGDIFKNAKP